MSYRFNMRFKELKRKDLLSFCIKLAKDFYDERATIIQNNRYYIPSISIGHTDVFEITDKEYRDKWRFADRNWLYRLFTIRFVYWEKMDLLGIMADVPDSLIKKHNLKEFYFQDSCEQDYDYIEWNGISYFEKVVKQYETATAAKLIRETNQEHSGYEKDEIENDLDYFRKEAIYEHIFQELDLNKWLYGHDGAFERFAFQALDTQEKELLTWPHLANVRKQFIEDFQRECEELPKKEDPIK